MAIFLVFFVFFRIQKKKKIVILIFSYLRIMYTSSLEHIFHIMFKILKD